MRKVSYSAIACLLVIAPLAALAQTWVDSVDRHGREVYMPADKYKWDWGQATFLNSLIHLYNSKSPSEKKAYLSYIQTAMDATYSVANGKHPNAVLMLESDPVFEDNFLDKLSEAMKKLDGKEWDFLSIGDGVGLKPQRPAGEKDLAWFSAPGFYHTRTTDAMIFKMDMLKKIMTTFFPFAEIIDWELNYQLQRHKSKSFWLDPIIVKNGSCAGVTKSTL